MPRGLRDAEVRPLEGGPGADLYRDGRLAARVYWHDTGELDHERHFDEAGRMHGVEREGFADGRTMYRARWSHGKQIGWQQQWDDRGRLLVRTRFVRGSGLDAWFCGGELSETRDYVDGQRTGFERLWSGRTRVWSEMHFKADLEHGIYRRWNTRHRLERGYPQFWIEGRRVTRRAYARASELDPALPPIRDVDDRPARRAPRVIEPRPIRRR